MAKVFSLEMLGFSSCTTGQHRIEQMLFAIAHYSIELVIVRLLTGLMPILGIMTLCSWEKHLAIIS